MPTYTPNLGLLEKDPVTEGSDNFNIETMLNDNWDKIDAAVGGTPRPNLLKNAYFVGGGSQLGNGVFPLNSRGQTTYTAQGHTIDRWYNDNAGTLVLNAGSVSFTGSGINLSQQISDPGNYAGKTVTGATLLSNGTLLYGTEVFPSVPASGWNFQTLFTSATVNFILGTSANNESRAFIQPQTANAVNIVAVKLELGESQTLAHQDSGGNWVLNEIPNFNEELIRCMDSIEDVFSPGDVIASAKRSMGDKWALCNGDDVRDFEAPGYYKHLLANYGGVYQSMVETTGNYPYGTGQKLMGSAYDDATGTLFAVIGAYDSTAASGQQNTIWIMKSGDLGQTWTYVASRQSADIICVYDMICYGGACICVLNDNKVWVYLPNGTMQEVDAFNNSECLYTSYTIGPVFDNGFVGVILFGYRKSSSYNYAAINRIAILDNGARVEANISYTTTSAWQGMADWAYEHTTGKYVGRYTGASGWVSTIFYNFVNGYMDASTWNSMFTTINIGNSFTMRPFSTGGSLVYSIKAGTNTSVVVDGNGGNGVFTSEVDIYAIAPGPGGTLFAVTNLGICTMQDFDASRFTAANVTANLICKLKDTAYLGLSNSNVQIHTDSARNLIGVTVHGSGVTATINGYTQTQYRYTRIPGFKLPHVDATYYTGSSIEGQDGISNVFVKIKE